MKGLIYRELYLARKTYMVGGIIVVLFVLLGVLIRLSLLYGNLAELEEDAFEFVDIASYYAFSYLPIVLLGIACSSDGGIIISDYRSKWCLYSYTLPMKEQNHAMVKFVIKVGALLLMFLLGIGNLALFAGLSGRNIESGSIQFLWIVIMLVGVISTVVVPMTIRYKSANAVIIRIAIALLLICMVLLFWLRSLVAGFINMDTDAMVDLLFEKMIGFRDILAMLSPVLLLFALLLGYLATVRQLKKREIM